MCVVQAVTNAADWSTDADERELVERAQRNREAFAVLYRRNYAALARHLYRRTGDVHATEDLVSDVFLTALRSLPRYRYRGVPLRFWLLRIATNVANRWARRQRRGAIASLEAGRRDAACPRSVSREEGADVERAQCALLTLPPRYQAVLSLHYLEGLAVRDVAAILGCRAGTVKSRLARARDALRQRLNGRR
jgi:RNA polymerase sigma factor (sigma-70 family)